MSAALLALVLVSALLHAGWNFAMKRSSGDLPTVRRGLAIAAAAATPVAAPLLALYPPDRTGWLCIAATGIAHALYFALLARLYRDGDLSSVYPLSRGLGVAGAALGAALLLGESFRPPGAAGIALVVAGILCAGARGLARAGLLPHVLAVGAVIASFALVDKTAVAHVHPVAYIWAMFLLPAFLLAPAARDRGAPDEASARLIGPGSMASYLLMLFAYRAGPLGYLVAAREIAIAFGAALGYFILKERVTPRRLLGIALVVTGLALIKAFG